VIGGIMQADGKTGFSWQAMSAGHRLLSFAITVRNFTSAMAP